VIGNYSAFLPNPWGTRTLQELTESITGSRDAEDTVSFTLNGLTAPWPTKPLYVLDKAIAEKR